MSYDLDISEVLALEADAVQTLEVRHEVDMKSIVATAASAAVAQRGYTNRTHKLSDGTKAIPRAGAAVELVADQEYASHVNAMRLMAIDEMAVAADTEIERLFNAEATRLGRR